MSLDNKTSVVVGDYEVIHNNGANLRALRFGEEWRDLTGDNLVLSLVDEIEYLKEVIKRLEEPYE